MHEKEFDIDHLEKFRNGNRQAFQAVFELLYKPVCELAFKVTGSYNDAEDICSEAFIKVYETKDRFESFQHIKAFLYTTAKRLSLNYLRNAEIHQRSHKEIAYLSSNLSAWEQILDEEIIFNELLREIHLEIDNLSRISTRYVQILQLTIFEKKKAEEIAQLLGISESTVRNLKAKAIKNLQIAFLKKGLLPTALVFELTHFILDKVRQLSSLPSA
jgi:RNA polymerase sigma factor (sigma-70 family)